MSLIVTKNKRLPVERVPSNGTITNAAWYARLVVRSRSCPHLTKGTIIFKPCCIARYDFDRSELYLRPETSRISLSQLVSRILLLLRSLSSDYHVLHTIWLSDSAPCTYIKITIIYLLGYNLKRNCAVWKKFFSVSHLLLIDFTVRHQSIKREYLVSKEVSF